MQKKLSVILLSLVFILDISSPSFAMCHLLMHKSHKHPGQAKAVNGPQVAEASPADSKEAVNVGNKICPVSGEKINERTKATYEYKGKIYNFCCAMCIEDFKKDPEKYIKKVNEELQKSQEPKEKMKSSEEMPAGMHEGH